MCDKYCARELTGGNELLHVLEQYLSSLVQIVHSFDGDVLNFAGDAIFSAWELDTITLSELARAGSSGEQAIWSPCAGDPASVGSDVRSSVAQAGGSKQTVREWVADRVRNSTFEVVPQALQCALALQAFCGEWHVDALECQLRIKTALTLGDFAIATVGNEDCATYVVVGYFFSPFCSSRAGHASFTHLYCILIAFL